jgi:hypothetical protein
VDGCEAQRRAAQAARIAASPRPSRRPGRILLFLEGI